MTPKGPDERVYNAGARTIRERGIRRGMLLLSERFLEDKQAGSYPSPLRWLWLLTVAALLRFGQRAPTVLAAILTPPALAWATYPLLGRQAFAAAALAACSPLLWAMGRRMLQDAPVALATLVTLGFALRAEPLGFAFSLLCLLGLKEAGILMTPALGVAWLLAGGQALPLLLSGGCGLAGWLGATRLLLGRRAVPVGRKAMGGHDAEYARKYQRGGVARLALDLLLISPAALLTAAFAPWQSLPLGIAAALIVVSHALAPIQNVRFVLAAELLIRALAAAAIARAGNQLLLAPLAAVDALIGWRIRNVYDPVTAALKSQLGLAR